MQDKNNVDQGETTQPLTADADKEIWVKPAITSFAPVKAAEGLSYRPLDGISNLT
jgi:hypothetical protein